MNPEQLRGSAYRLGPAGLPYPKETHFHFELYRTLYDILGGAMYAVPEFGLQGTKHSIDILIPSRNWGVELIYDSRDLKAHLSRFHPDGSYAAMGLQDHIILNFRLSHPQKPHLGTSSLQFIKLHS